MIEKIVNPFLTVTQAVERANIRRKAIDSKSLCKYFISSLDDALCGFLPSELVVIGADTGVGKSEIANHIAYENAKAGRDVFLFSLEGDKDEVINRLKWRHICENYFRNEMWKHRPLTLEYNKYITNQLDLGDLEEHASLFIEATLGDNLKIFDRSSSIESDEMIKALEWKVRSVQIEAPTEKNPFGKKEYRCEADLIVIDHLHYFDLPDGENELSHTTKIVREIKKFTDEYSTPVLLVSHLRKKYKDRGLPDVEDLHGSSNIGKIASTVILIHPNYADYDHNNMIYGTFIRIAKSRSGIKPTLCAMTRFDGKIRAYEKNYEIWKINRNSIPEKIDYAEWPAWAKNQSK